MNEEIVARASEICGSFQTARTRAVEFMAATLKAATGKRDILHGEIRELHIKYIRELHAKDPSIGNQTDVDSLLSAINEDGHAGLYKEQVRDLQKIAERYRLRREELRRRVRQMNFIIYQLKTIDPSVFVWMYNGSYLIDTLEIVRTVSEVPYTSDLEENGDNAFFKQGGSDPTGGIHPSQGS